MGLQVTPEDVLAAATSCRSTAGNIEVQLNQLQAYVTQMEEIWGGVAATTFQGLMADYNSYSNMLYNALMDIASGLNGNYVNYTDGEAANIKSIDSVNESLGLPVVAISVTHSALPPSHLG
jgi:WXG100 family type VII secretion target